MVGKMLFFTLILFFLSSPLPAGPADVHYFLSNEYDQHRLQLALPPVREAVIVTGGLRAFDRVGMGKFAEGHIIDQDPAVINFGRWINHQLKKGISRQNLLRALFGLPPKISLAPLEWKVLAEWFETHLPDEMELVWMQEVDKGMTAYQYRRNRNLFWRDALNFLAPEIWPQTFLGNDDFFSWAQNRAQQNLLHFYLGRWEDGVTLKAIAADLTARQRQASLVDLSNIAQIMRPGALEIIWESLGNLPWVANGSVVGVVELSHFSIDENWQRKNWSYRTLSVENILTLPPPEISQYFRDRSLTVTCHGLLL
jgi:hypothetical protein